MSQVVDNKVVVTSPCIAAVNIAAVGADFTLTGFSKISAADKIAHWRIIADSSVLEKWNILEADTEYKFLNTLQAPLQVLYILCFHSFCNGMEFFVNL